MMYFRIYSNSNEDWRGLACRLEAGQWAKGEINGRDFQKTRQFVFIYCLLSLRLVYAYQSIQNPQGHSIIHSGMDGWAKDIRCQRFKVFIILLMSQQRSKSFFREYARSGYEGKMNPEFDGIARKYYKEKKEHEKVHTLKAKLDKEVAFMERMERKMEQHLHKKQNELRYAKEVSTRFQNDLRRREWINEFHSKEVKNNQQKATLIKSQSEARLQEAKDYLREQKRSLATLNREENQRVKDERTIKRAKEWDANRNKVHEIYQSKKEVKVSCNQFYQSRTGSSLKNYQSRISTFQEYKATDHQNIRSLEQRLTDLKQNSNQKRDKAAELSQQINKLKQEAKLESNLIRSQMRSRSSLSAYSARSGRSQGQSPSGRLSEMKAHE